MKKIYSFLIMPFIGMALSLGSCSDDNGGNNNSGNGGNNNGGGQEPVAQVHYDIWVGLEQNAMGRFGTLLVKNVNSLEGNGSVTFEGEGCDVTATFGKTESSIIRGQYYYAVDAVNEDRYVKYRIMNNQLERNWSASRNASLAAILTKRENTPTLGWMTTPWLFWLPTEKPMKYYGPNWTPRP